MSKTHVKIEYVCLWNMPTKMNELQQNQFILNTLKTQRRATTYWFSSVNDFAILLIHRNWDAGSWQKSTIALIVWNATWMWQAQNHFADGFMVHPTASWVSTRAETAECCGKSQHLLVHLWKDWKMNTLWLQAQPSSTISFVWNTRIGLLICY